MNRLTIAFPAIVLIAGGLAACGESGGPDSGADAGADAASDARVWLVDYGQSTLGVHGEYGAKGFDGAFNEWNAEIIFSPEDLEGSSIQAEIMVASFESGDSSRDQAARSDRWLSAEQFPTAVYQSDSIEAGAEGGYVSHGTLTVAGMTNPLDLEFTVEIDGDTAHATGQSIFDHHDLGIDGGYDDADTGDMFAVTLDITANAGGASE